MSLSNSVMTKKTRIAAFLVFAVLTIAWMLVIFGFSANNAVQSTIQSNKVTEFAVKLFVGNFDELPQNERDMLIEQYDGIIRKLAHFGIYAILAFLAYFASGSPAWLPYKMGRPAAVSLPVCVVFAVTDEYHQTFVDGRAGRMTDVLIDSSGAVCGTLFAAALAAVIYKMMAKRNKKGV